MLGDWNPFRKGGGGKKQATLDRILEDLAKMDPNSVNCSLLKSQGGEEINEDLERAFIFKHGERMLVQNKAFYITTPDGIKAGDKSQFSGKGEILHLWFLYHRIPHTLDCRVMSQVRFPDTILEDLAPRIPVAYMLRPVGNIRKVEKRQFLRYAHKAGHGNRRVYSQVLFDLHITKTDVTFPETGSLPPHITDLHPVAYTNASELADQTPEEVVKFMKNAIRLNPRDGRVVYVSKPNMDERTNKVSLLEMGESDVLGLETSRKESEQQRETRTFYIRKPPNMDSDRRSAHNLQDGDTIVLNFHSSVSSDSPTEYYDMISEITRIGTENMTARTGGDIRKEAGLPVEMIDFSIGGIKIETSEAFLKYVLGEQHQSMNFEEKVELLQSTCYLLNFYPKLRFNRETEIYKPEIPMRIQTLAKIDAFVRSPGSFV